MSDYVVVEPGLGRVLPGPVGKRTTITTWAAHQAVCNADHRRKQPVYAELAARLQITREDKPDD